MRDKKMLIAVFVLILCAASIIVAVNLPGEDEDADPQNVADESEIDTTVTYVENVETASSQYEPTESCSVEVGQLALFDLIILEH